MSVHKKLGIILENKVVQKLSLEKIVFTKKWSPKLKFFFEKIQLIIDIESTNYVLYSIIMCIFVLSINTF